MGVKEVKAFKTSDGTLWEDKEEADASQVRLDFTAWYDDTNNGLIREDAEDVCDWLLDNREMIIKFLERTA